MKPQRLVIFCNERFRNVLAYLLMLNDLQQVKAKKIT